LAQENISHGQDPAAAAAAAATAAVTAAAAAVPVADIPAAAAALPGAGDAMDVDDRTQAQDTAAAAAVAAAATEPAEAAVNGTKEKGLVDATAAAAANTTTVMSDAASTAAAAAAAADAATATTAAATAADAAAADASAPPAGGEVYLVPGHAAWFRWGSVHELERAGLPEFFTNASATKTPAAYHALRAGSYTRPRLRTSGQASRCVRVESVRVHQLCTTSKP
jgi:hypothetical protein